MATVFLDRIEGGIAVLVYDDQSFDLPAALLPAGAAEGDVLTLTLAPDPQATEAQRRRLAERRASLSQGDDGGDFSL